MNGRDYTSNTRKLLHHLDKLKDFQEGKPISPVMAHLSLTARCNLNCSYCCYENRNKKEELTLEQVKSVIDQFTSIGTKGIELTGSGEPTLHPDINEIILYAKSKGASLGLITNGINAKKVEHWDKIDWVRISPHVLNLDNKVLEDKLYENTEFLKSTGTSIGSVYIWSDDNPGFLKFLDYIEKYRLPSRVTPDLTKDTDWVQREMKNVKHLLQLNNSRYAFISDFNIKLDRPIQNCYLRLLKPFVHTDGYLYDCPGSSFNSRDVDPKFRVCSIDEITKYYTSPKSLDEKSHDCGFCKYQHFNELMFDVKSKVKDIDFT